MIKFANEVVEGGKLLGYALSLLPDLCVGNVKDTLSRRYGIRYWTRIWERFGDHASVQDQEAWRWMDEFVRGDEAIIFFDEDDDKSMALFDRNVPVVPILAECTPVDFYLTNRSGDYILCFNHHDFLVGVGGAKEWVANKWIESTR